MEIAYVMIGHSHYDDILWEWLRKNANSDLDTAIMNEQYDHSSAWGILILAGCRFELMEECDGVNIYYDGTVEELIAKLDGIIR